MRKKEYLCDLNDQRIEKSVKVKLNSQLLYSATMTPRERATIVRGLKEYFGKLLATPKQFPLFLSITFLCPREDIEDLDNLVGIYQKCFIDSLKSRGRKTTEGDTTYYNYPGRPFPDDNVDYLSCLLQRWYSYPTRYLVFDLYEMSSYQEDRQIFIDKLFAE